MQTLELALTPEEEEVLQLFKEYIEQRTDKAMKRLAERLASYISVSYYLGAEKALKEAGAEIRAPDVGTRAVGKLVEEEVAPSIAKLSKTLSRQLTDIIDKGIRERRTYAEISSQLRETLKTKFGREIRFNNVGDYREVVKVGMDGRLRLVKERIKLTKTMSVEDYADVLARTNVKKAYELGRQEGYRAAGRRRWRYMSAADERTRPTHLSQHGKIFEIGTEQSDLALRLMSEPRCRCGSIIVTDTPQEKFDEERKKWAQRWQTEKGLDSLGKHLEPFDRKNLTFPSYNEQLNYLTRKFQKSEDMRTLLSITGESPQSKAKEILGISLRHSTFHGTASSYRHMVQDGRRYSLSDVFSIKKSPEWVRRDPDTAEFLLHGKSKIHQRPIYIILTPDRKIKTSFVITKRKEVEKLKMRFKEELK